MRYLLIFLFCLLHFVLTAQDVLEGRVVDSQSLKPLPYASVALMGTGRGTITNEDGIFKLRWAQAGDTLLFSFLGYQKKTVIIGEELKLEVKLVPKTHSLKEFTIAADGDPYFDILVKCRRQLLKYSNHDCKAYLEMHTDVSGTPGEVIEIYYNANVRTGNLYSLNYKSGRQALARVDDSYFLSLSTTSIFQSFKLVEGDFNIPTNPLELSKGKMKKLFDLSLISYGDDDPYFHILFKPKKDEQKIFEGEIWIDKESYRPIEIKLHIEDALVKPFVPIFPKDSLGNVYMDITQRFGDFESDLVPTLLQFEYGFKSIVPKYTNVPDYQNSILAEKPVHSNGIIYYYDYGVPFIDPLFDYQTGLDDYQKIQNTPYHEAFWDQESVLLASDRQEMALRFFQENGFLNNYSEQAMIPLKTGLGTKLDHTNRMWSDTTRLFFDEKFKQELEAEQYDSRYAIPDRAKYNLNVKLYLDIVETADTLIHYSESVFDVYDSYYNLPNDSLTNAFINIHFDMAEIARREMEDEIGKLKNPSPEAIIKIHERTMEDLNDTWQVYLDKTGSGSSYPALREYNDKIEEELGIDNFKIFDLDEPLGQVKTTRLAE